MRLCDIASALSLDLLDPQKVTSFCIDSRDVIAGSVFLAFKGTRVDGHQYLDKAREKGAVLALVEEKQSDALMQLVVPSMMEAIIKLATYYRTQWCDTKVIAVTGSAGKTSSKEMLKVVCEGVFTTYATYKNQNNLLGLSLNILNKPVAAKVAILELGINAPGEMKELVALAKPHVSIITNIGACHLEGLGNEVTIAKEKSAIFSGLSDDGVAIFDADSPYVDIFRQRSSHVTQLCYSANEVVNIARVSSLSVNDQGCYRFDVTCDDVTTRYSLSVCGRYQVYNAVGVILAAYALGVKAELVVRYIATYQGTQQRFEQWKLPNGSLLIDDGYNANPLALKAAISAMNDLKFPINALVLADMKELGEQSVYWHERIASYLLSSRVTHVFTYGDLAKITSQNVKNINVQHFNDIASLTMTLQRFMVSTTCCVLLKGSRSMGLERVRHGVLLQKELS